MIRSVREVLIAARALIDTPEKWCKGHSRLIVIDGPVITKRAYCSSGAVLSASSTSSIDVIDPTYRALKEAIPRPGKWRSVAEFNDDPTTAHADVMALFSRAIAATAETEAQ